ncbi:hypothetical protein BDZ89DRAFT_1126808 [Hymenopellis radicata]|nr:hypothetical protein BDZ89DRAFT_1126808 [Hymenopellis radicata]
MTEASTHALMNPIGFGAMDLSAFLGLNEDDEARFKVSVAPRRVATKLTILRPEPLGDPFDFGYNWSRSLV